jgi:capsular exopolysaccharide synthesis family protein
METERGALLQEIVRVPWRQRILVLVVTALTTVVALGWALAQPTVYAASSRILVSSLSEKERKALGVASGDVSSFDTVPIAAQAKLISGPEIAKVVSDSIGNYISTEALAQAVDAEPVGEDQIEITAMAPTPELAQAEANAFADAYLAYRASQARAEVDVVNKALVAERAAIDVRVAELGAKLEQDAASLGLLPPAELSDTAQQAIRASLESEIDRSEAQRDELQKARQELSTTEGDLAAIGSSPGQIVRRAALPGSPAGPGALSIGMAGLAIGLMVGVAVAFIRDRLSDRVGADDESWAEGAPVLARLPRSDRKNPSASDLLVAATGATSQAAEAYRSLRESLAARGLGEEHRILLVTSPGRREGKSSTAANLAAALAGSGLQTVAVSADLRRPRLGAYFGVDDHPGLVEVLKGSAKLEAALRTCSIPNLTILPTAPESATGSDLLATPAFARLLRSLADQADVVVVDAAGVADGADAAILGGLCGASLLVVQDGVTLAGAAARAVQALSRAGAAPLGAVISPAPPTSAPVRVAVAGLGAGTLFLGSVVWASTAQVRGAEAGAVAYQAPQASPSATDGAPAAPAAPGSPAALEMSPEIRALWEAAQRAAEPPPVVAAPESPAPSKAPAKTPTKTSPAAPKPGAPAAPSSPSAPAPSSPSAPSTPTPSSPTPPPPPPPPPPSPIPFEPLDANDDSMTTLEDTPGQVSPLSNDEGVAGRVTAPITISSQPDHGTVSVGSDSRVTYVPEANFHGNDNFSYRVTTVDGETSSARVEITVAPANDGPPAAADDSVSVDHGEGTSIDVTDNDTSVDGITSVAVASGPANGTAVVDGNDIRYQPNGGFSGTDTFTYTITDADGDTATATVTVTVAAPAPPPDPGPFPPFFP